MQNVNLFNFLSFTFRILRRKATKNEIKIMQFLTNEEKQPKMIEKGTTAWKLVDNEQKLR